MMAGISMAMAMMNDTRCFNSNGNDCNDENDDNEIARCLDVSPSNGRRHRSNGSTGATGGKRWGRIIFFPSFYSLLTLSSLSLWPGCQFVANYRSMFYWRGIRSCGGRNLQTHSDARESLRWLRKLTHWSWPRFNLFRGLRFLLLSETSGFFSSEASGPEQQSAEWWVASHRADRGEGGEQHGSLTGAGGGGFFWNTFFGTPFGTLFVHFLYPLIR